MDAAARAHHQAHVVVDQQDRHALGRQAADHLAERRGLVGVEAGRRLVEQHEPRPRGEGAPEVDQALPAVGQLARAGLGLRGEAEPLDDLVDSGDGGRAAGRHRVDHEGPPMAPPGCDLEVLADRQVGEELAGLERAGQAGVHPPVRRLVADVATGEGDAAPGRGDEAADGVDARGLAGAVRPDQPHDLAILDGEVDLRHRGDAAVHHRQPPDVEQRARIRRAAAVAVPVARRPVRGPVARVTAALRHPARRRAAW